MIDNTPPVLLIAYKRYLTTKLVFEEIRKAKPKKFFFAVDGPKKNVLGDAEKVAKVKSIVDLVDWKCEVKVLFSETNRGSKVTESEAINFFFDNVDEGIVLEDDCLPNQSFFMFCGVLLEKYRHDERIMQISGSNFQFENIVGDESYYFSKRAHTWGWATWKRAWKFYDVDMKNFPEFKSKNYIDNIFESKEERKYYLSTFQATFEGKIDCWDHQWLYAILSQGGLSIQPNKNLITNIGFGPEGTYCTDSDNLAANVPLYDLKNIIHPEFVVIRKEADMYEFEKLIHDSIFKQINRTFKRVVRIIKHPRTALENYLNRYKYLKSE